LVLEICLRCGGANPVTNPTPTAEAKPKLLQFTFGRERPTRHRMRTRDMSSLKTSQVKP